MAVSVGAVAQLLTAETVGVADVDNQDRKSEASDSTSLSKPRKGVVADWRQLDSDDLFTDFSRASFDTGEFLKNAVNDSTAILTTLQTSLHRIDESVRTAVVSQSDELFSQSEDVSRLKENLKETENRVAILRNNISRVRTGFVHPFNEFRSKSQQLKNLQKSGTLLRAILRTKKLHSQLQLYLRKQSKDLTKAAACVAEIRNTLAQYDLEQITLIENQKSFVASAHQQIKDLSKQKLAAGLRTLNQSEIAVSLQIFYNLGHSELRNITMEVLSTAAQQSSRQLIFALTSADNSDVSQSGINISDADDTNAVITDAITTKSNPNDALSYKQSIWLRLDKCLNHHFFGSVLQIWNLEKVLRKKMDILTRSVFIDLIPLPQRNLTIFYWSKLVSLIAEQFRNASNDSSFVANLCVNEYPRLWALLCEFYSRVEETTQHTDPTLIHSQIDKLSHICGSQYRRQLIDSIAYFRTIFIDKSRKTIEQPLKVLLDPKKTPTTLPTQSDMTTLFTTFYNEMRATNDVSDLRDAVASIVTDGVSRLIAQTERNRKAVFEMRPYLFDESLLTSPKSDSYPRWLTDNSERFNLLNRLADHFANSPIVRIPAIEEKLNQSLVLFVSDALSVHSTQLHQTMFARHIRCYKESSAEGGCNCLSTFSSQMELCASLFLSLYHKADARQKVLTHWCIWLTLNFLISIATVITDSQTSLNRVVSEMARFGSILRTFEDKLSIDIVDSLLTLQQFKRLLTHSFSDPLPTFVSLQQTYPNLPKSLLCVFLFTKSLSSDKFITVCDATGISGDMFLSALSHIYNYNGLRIFDFEQCKRFLGQIVSSDELQVSDNSLIFSILPEFE